MKKAEIQIVFSLSWWAGMDSVSNLSEFMCKRWAWILYLACLVWKGGHGFGTKLVLTHVKTVSMDLIFNLYLLMEKRWARKWYLTCLASCEKIGMDLVFNLSCLKVAGMEMVFNLSCLMDNSWAWIWCLICLASCEEQGGLWFCLFLLSILFILKENKNDLVYIRRWFIRYG